MSSGYECKYEDGSQSGSYGNSGGNPSGVDGTNQGTTGLVDVGAMKVGDKLTTDLGVGFNAVANNVNKSAAKVEKAVKELATQFELNRIQDNINYMDSFRSDLTKIAINTSGLGSAGSGAEHELSGYLKSINDKTVLDPTMWNNHHAELMQIFNDIRKDMSYMGSYNTPQELINIDQKTNSMTRDLTNISENSNSLKGTLWNISDEVQRQGYDISDMLKELKKISSGEGGNGNGGGDGGGDKPCEGPLCTFTPPTSNPATGLASVFGEDDIAGIKQQVADRKADVQEQMDEIRKVFSPGKIEISGTYDNDYQDIHGARVDLSGKSNLELFFSLGPKQVLWFLAVLIAFGILLGGRKDA